MGAEFFTHPNAQTRTEIVAQIVDGIAERGIVVVERFLPVETIVGMRAQAAQLRADGEFRPAGIGAGGDFRMRDDIRGDEIFWIDSGAASGALSEALAAFEQLRQAINRELYLGMSEFECHFARYSPGKGYQRHYDQLRGDGRRVLTVTLYLNENWRPADGGALRVYVEDNEPPGTLDVLPEAGTLVTFLSANFAHEVLPCTRERLSFTGWYRRR